MVVIRKSRIGVIAAFAGLLCLASFRLASGEEMTAAQLVTDVNQKWSNVQNFQADMSTGIQMLGKMMEFKGTVWVKGKFFRMEMTMPTEMMPQAGGSAEPPKMLQVFDGKTMWQWMPAMKMVTRIDLPGMEDKSNNSPLSIPSLPYTLSEKFRDGKPHYLLVSADVADYLKKSAPAGVSTPPKSPFRGIGFWVDKSTLMVDFLEFYTEDNTVGMYVRFDDVKVNQDLSPDLFTFQVPEGAQVMDMTEAVKAMSAKPAK